MTRVGFMGMVHYLSYQKVPGAKVVALCDANSKRLAGDWTDIQGNFGPAGEQMDLTGIATYESSDELLGDPNIDLVDITLPPAAHAGVAIAALESGKHVFCEKPMAMTVEDCDRMLVAAKKADKQLLIGHVLPYFPEYAWALHEVTSGKHGRVLGGSFKRVIADPSWLANYWSAEAVGGPMLDLHVHDAHYIRLLFGMPEAVTTWGRTRNGLAAHWHTNFDYGPQGPVVHAMSGTIDQQGRAFNQAFEIQLEHATLVFEFAVIDGEGVTLCPPTIFRDDSKVERVQLPGGDPMDAFAEEIHNVVHSVQGSVLDPVADGHLARDAIHLCQKQTESLHSRCRVVI
ncbi:Gfo/Idh/MocA family protein [Bythopirellula goksoeyrii]|uniref:Glucose--fructose oxidoreductase n=1 Tax=Bythopirellula goksoeyrii TaxID=1400387 RepID=A0A5B9QGH5_9BACT|nr:Gfo/Idh/MocA family oxidoreductase [Bythopirellula goksoeyrii]QEG33451.1 Glucose--fructose oxidoreductase precursor [Bythopirellula goksoeyrii]